MPVVVLALLVGLAGCEDAPPPAPETQPAETRYNDSYIGALAAANGFCHAWLQRDETAGRALLSLRMIRRYPDELLRDAIVGQANPRHAAYEIFKGQRLPDGRYAFDVRLFFRYTGGHADLIESPLTQVVMARDEANAWRVDEFPVPETHDRPRGMKLDLPPRAP